jgi:hypothetical protein
MKDACDVSDEVTDREVRGVSQIRCMIGECTMREGYCHLLYEFQDAALQLEVSMKGHKSAARTIVDASLFSLKASPVCR